MEMFAVSNIGGDGTCTFTDKFDTTLFYIKTEKLESEKSVTSIYDGNNNLLFLIQYLNSKIQAKKFIVTEANENLCEVVLTNDNKIVCDKLNISLSRSMCNKKIKVYQNDKLICNIKCKTLIRQWLQGKYNVDILDENQVNLCVCMAVISFIAISDEYICKTVRESF